MACSGANGFAKMDVAIEAGDTVNDYMYGSKGESIGA